MATVAVATRIALTETLSSIIENLTPQNTGEQIGKAYDAIRTAGFPAAATLLFERFMDGQSSPSMLIASCGFIVGTNANAA